MLTLRYSKIVISGNPSETGLRTGDLFTKKHQTKKCPNNWSQEFGWNPNHSFMVSYPDHSAALIKRNHWFKIRRELSIYGGFKKFYFLKKRLDLVI